MFAGKMDVFKIYGWILLHIDKDSNFKGESGKKTTGISIIQN